MTVAAFIAIAIASYALGAIPFSYIAGKMFAGIDLREHGSGNLGASNTFRMLGSKIAVAVLICDIAKGYLPVHFAYLASGLAGTAGSAAPIHWLMLVAALAAVLGHMYSVFVGFSGRALRQPPERSSPSSPGRSSAHSPCG
jgi:glycerol-3-phosphate acyltransferase PlsY